MEESAVMKMNHWIGAISCAAMISCFAGPSRAEAATDIGVLTVGHAYDGNCGGHGLQYSGFNPAFSAGSYSPTGLTGGQAVTVLADFAQIFCGVNLTFLKVSGFATNPGSTWLTSVTCNEVTNIPATGSFSFTGNTGWWGWSSKPFGLAPLRDGANVSCSIVHN
jgi:hypothetical protein